MWGQLRLPLFRGAIHATIIGLDIAKSVLQVLLISLDPVPDHDHSIEFQNLLLEAEQLTIRQDIRARHQARRLHYIPGVGPLLVTRREPWPMFVLWALA
jgi:hypothetical protein